MAATAAVPMQSIEIVGERRRAHNAAFRSRILSEAMVPGVRIADLARRHGICTSLIYRWRREAAPRVGAASAVQLVPVKVNGARLPGNPAAQRSSAPEPRRSGVIEIELEGGIRVRVDGDVSLAALRRVVAVLRG